MTQIKKIGVLRGISLENWFLFNSGHEWFGCFVRNDVVGSTTVRLRYGWRRVAAAIGREWVGSRAARILSFGTGRGCSSRICEHTMHPGTRLIDCGNDFEFGRWPWIWRPWPFRRCLVVEVLCWFLRFYFWSCDFDEGIEDSWFLFPVSCQLARPFCGRRIVPIGRRCFAPL